MCVCVCVLRVGGWVGRGAGTIHAQTSITFLYFLKCLTCEELIRIRQTCKEFIRFLSHM